MLIASTIQLMASLLYQLSLCIVAVIQLTSSQSTWDNEVSSCADNEQALNQIISMITELTGVVSQLQRDVAEIKDE